MQVDRMCSAEAAIIIKQNKKQRGGHLFDKRVIVHCLIMAQRQRLVNILSKSAINGRGKGGKKKRTCRRADEERRKKINI